MSEIKTPTWTPDPHTLAKHEILKRYLKAWFPILGSKNRRVVYLDGFAGPGIYEDGSKGSPVIALECLIEHQLRTKLTKTEFVFIFIERDRKRKEILEGVLKKQFPELPDNIKIHVINAEFAPTMNEILDDLERYGANLAPTFAFLDPFGYAGLPLETIKRMMSYKSCEVLINFNYKSINRFVQVSDTREKVFDELFGTKDWRKVRSIDNPRERRLFLIELYKSQLKQFCKYISSFEMVDKFNQVLYDLVFATKHIKGLEVMKNAMWMVGPPGSYRFSDTTDVRQVRLIDYFGGDDFWVSDAAEMVFKEFKGKTATVDEIYEFVIAKTPFKFKKEILKRLEIQGKIADVKNRKRRLTYPDGCEIIFSE